MRASIASIVSLTTVLAGCTAMAGEGDSQSVDTFGARVASAVTAPKIGPGPSSATRPPPVRAKSRKPDDQSDYLFPVERCRARYGRSHHDYPAADIFGRVGCPVVSVTDGVVHEVSRRDSWRAAKNDGATRGGLFVSVLGDDGVRYYYSHLSRIASNLEVGDPVAAGERLGSVGKTGSARGTPAHVHFGLSWPTPAGTWWIRRGVLQPAPFLDDWRAGKATSPAKKISRLKQAAGEKPRCSSAC